MIANKHKFGYSADKEARKSPTLHFHRRSSSFASQPGEEMATRNKYVVGVDRFLIAKQKKNVHTVSLFEKGSTVKRVEFSAVRWAAFVALISRIEESLKEAEDDAHFEFVRHIGGGYHVSVTAGYSCVDIRKFHMPPNAMDPEPGRTGLALRLPEWRNLKGIIDRVHADFPTLATTQPCDYEDDHKNQIGYLRCLECNPFDDSYRNGEY